MRWSIGDVLAAFGVTALAFLSARERLPRLLDAVVLWVLALAVLSLGLAFLRGGRSQNGFRLRRGVTQVAYTALPELVLAVGFVHAAIDLGAFEFSSLVRHQSGAVWGFYAFGGWGAYVTFLAALVSLVMIDHGTRSPAPFAERRPRSLIEALLLWGRTGFVVAVFLGGWQPRGLLAIGVACFALKVVVLVAATGFVRASLGEPRPESLARAFAWMLLVTGSFATLALFGVSIRFIPWLEWTVTHGLDGLWVVFVVLLVALPFVLSSREPPKRATGLNPWI
jgi:NADH:ubiquinone oxidoreductase subunit H